MDIAMLRNTLIAMPIRRYIFDSPRKSMKVRRRRHPTKFSTAVVPTILPNILRYGL